MNLPIRIFRSNGGDLIALAVATALFIMITTGSTTELVLAEDGKTTYEIVLPDASQSETIANSLRQTARLIQTTFAANGVEIPVVAEATHEKVKPGIFLGDTALARAQGVDVSQLTGWGYVHQVVNGRDLIIAGHDHPAPADATNPRRPVWDRLGTAKGVADFLRQYAGVRFLYPEIGPYQPVAKAETIDLLTSPAIEFLPLPKIVVPGDLNVEITPTIAFNTAHPAGGSFYDIANNRFPRVDEVFGGHTWERAIPTEEYRKSHPEYFALVGGKRLLEGAGQYCISNPEVQELIYQDLCRWLDRGYLSVDLGQPDGFRPCQCEECAKLYETGDDWGEKIWILNLKLAERLLESHPGKQVTMMSYILTAEPPKTFTAFPANTKIMLTGTNEEDIAPWHAHKVPGGFSGYLYNWCPNLGTRYTPMRTPGHVETQAKRLAANHIQSFYRDGPGALFGLEGPVYYTMGRMYDDPENLFAKDLVPEFIDAAFGESAWHMKQFYDQLYHSITLYSDFLGTRSPAWTYYPIEGRRRKMVTDPFQLLAFLYPPPLLNSLEEQLTQAGQKAKSEKVKARLALVRREFDYLKSLAKVVHLHQAFQVQPDLGSRDRLLDAIDARNAELVGYWNEKGRALPVSEGWSWVMFPPAGHNYEHLRLAHNGYQEPYESTCMNWDTAAMRAAPLPGAKRLTVGLTETAPTLDSPEWKTAAEQSLAALPGDATALTGETHFKVLRNGEAIHVRIESQFPAGVDIAAGETVEVFLAPIPGKEIIYRFRVGPQPESKEDAASGFITDAMDPRHGRFDPDWNGEWTHESRIDQATGRWITRISIPFSTLGIEAPEAGSFWRANAGRVHVVGPERNESSAWSVAAGMRRLDDLIGLGEWVFEQQ
ncbi:MAG: DUF4838 domain-containing protein [Verrucomicrobiae bacterium]|nr:DUF4838 domain-containing protein [Verrucomicrobiae bacterium]